MQYTSSEVAKLLRCLNEEHDTFIGQENLGSTFIVASGEDVESLRPEYDYAQMQEALKENEAKIRRIKHALNVFNSTHKLPGYDITVDEALVLIPQLSARKARLGSMRANLPKTRERGIHSGGNIIASPTTTLKTHSAISRIPPLNWRRSRPRWTSSTTPKNLRSNSEPVCTGPQGSPSASREIDQGSALLFF